jgi:hypothetical protein
MGYHIFYSPMIAWRTSRFLLLFFLLMLATLGIAGTTIVSQKKLNFWRESLVVIRSLTQDNTATTPTPLSGPGQPIELSRYPVVQVTKPAVSIFDPAG